MRKFIFSISIGVLALSSACGDSTVTRYSTVQDAKNGRLFERGWVPEVLPDTAGPLIEAHNIDTNVRCALAEFPPATFAEVLAALSRVGFHHYDAPVPPPPLNACPFSNGDFRQDSVVMRRTGVSGDQEFVGVSKSGTFMFMGIK